MRYILSIFLLCSLLLTNDVYGSCSDHKWSRANKAYENSIVSDERATKTWSHFSKAWNNSSKSEYYPISAPMLAAYDQYSEAFEVVLATYDLWYNLHHACDGENSETAWQISRDLLRASEKMDKILIQIEKKIVKFTAESIKKSDFRALSVFTSHNEFKIDGKYKNQSYLQVSMATDVRFILTDLLLKKGAKINEIYSEEVAGNGLTKGTALSRAVAFGQIDKLKALLKYGADANIPFNSPRTRTISPLDLAVANYMVLSQQNGSANRLIAKAIIIDQLFKNGATALIYDKVKIERDIKKILLLHAEDLQSAG